MLDWLVIGRDFEQDVAELVGMTVEACAHEQGADSVTESDLLDELAVVDSLEPGFDLSQPLQPENREVEAVH